MHATLIPAALGASLIVLGLTPPQYNPRFDAAFIAIGAFLLAWAVMP